MSNDSNFNGSGNSSSTATAEHWLPRAQAEAEKPRSSRWPHIGSRAELQATRELAEGLGEVDKALNDSTAGSRRPDQRRPILRSEAKSHAQKAHDHARSIRTG
jgi:hypothetical protein